jgi:hypothetical protein
MTPLINADTWLGAASADQRQDKNKRSDGGIAGNGSHAVESVGAFGSCQQTEREQQGQCTKACHRQVDEPRAGVFGMAVMGHDQRPRRQRHEFPGGQKRKGICGQHNDIHACQKCRIKRQHTVPCGLMLAITDGIK